MKVLIGPQIFELQFFGGISLYFSILINNFKKRKDIEFEFPLVYSDNRYLRELNFLNYKSFHNENFPFKNQIKKYLLGENRKQIINCIKKQDFDVFHPSYFDSYYLKHIKNKPFVLTVHDMTNEVLPEYFIFDKNAEKTIEIKKLLMQKASRIIAISENTKKDILKFTDINEEKIDVVYHGKPLYIPENVPELENLPAKYILFVGQRAKYKNFTNFLYSIADFLKQDEDLYLLSVGGFGFNKSEKEIIASLNLNKKVIYMPIENNMNLIQFYQKALFFVFPSLYEGFGFPILEAFQNGCPLICSNTSSFPEVAGDAALYFDPYDEISIKSAVEKLLYNNDLRKELVQKGYKQAEKFSWQKCTDETIKVYQKVV